jgi:hypothetical protein
MSRVSKRKLMIAVAVAAIAAGAIVAVVSSGGGHTGASSAARVRADAAAARARGHTEVGAAADYLGLTKAQLRTQLRSGRTLAQIADATGGKSATGLIEALLGARAAQLNAEVDAKELSPAAERGRLARLRRRLTAQLERTPGYSNLPVSARYLGISTAQLRAELHAGRSLAQIAAATPGKSSAGLIDARVSAREAALAATLASGKLSRATERALASGLRQRVTSEVERKPTP